MKRAEQAWTTNIPQKTGKSVTTIEQFLLQHPAGEQILVIGAGPYRVNFQIVNCFECSGANLLRHYCVKTLAIAGRSDELDDAQQCAQLTKMDGIALAKDLIASPLWITTGERGQFIGLGTLYLPFPKWVSQSNAIVDRRINELSASGDVLPPVAAFTAGNDASGRKCLRAVCQHCNTSLSISDSCGPIRFSFTLQGQDGEKGLMRWPLAVGGLSMVDLIGQQARHCKNIISFRKIQLFLCDPPRKKPPTSEPVEGFFVFKSAWLG